ncbi:MAG: threonine dehydratase [Myxococcota bacterium]|jgi:threonine dehydratase
MSGIHPTLRAAIRSTTIQPAPGISRRLGRSVTLVSEVDQITGSFKLRAAYNVAATVESDHLIAASSGNFGQALAYACKVLGKRATIVMPENSARVKIDAVRSHGATAELIDTTVISRADRVAQLAAAYPGAHVASAYNDPLVIAGNSTLGEEIAGLDVVAVVVPVGGGGLSAGVITGLCRVGSTIAVFGAEPAMADDAARSLAAGVLLRNEHEPQTIADGARTVSLGVHNWAVIQPGIAGILRVSEADIEMGVRLLAADGVRVEPTGALAVGALLRSTLPAGPVACVLSGGNVDEAVYRRILDSNTGS